MSNISIPQFVEDVIERFDDSISEMNEAQVYDALCESRKANEPLNEEDFKGFQAEASAFLFYGRPENDSVWGTYFAPALTGCQKDGTQMLIPDVKDLSNDVLAHWQARAKSAKNPVLRARYADLVWDLTHVVGGGKASIEFAGIAIDAYLEGTSKRRFTMEIRGIQWCERALDLALSISDRNTVRRVVESMFELHRQSASPRPTGTFVFLFDNLYGRSFITPDEQAEIISSLEDALAKTSDSTNAQTFNPHAADAAAARLAKHYDRLGSKEEVQRVVRAYGKAFEHAATSASPMVAMAWLQPVIERYHHVGLKADVERAQLTSLEKGKNIEAELKQLSATVKIDREKLDEFVEETTSGGLNLALLNIATRFIPDVNSARGFLAKSLRTSPLQAFIGVSRIDEFQITAKAGSLEEDPDGRLHMDLARDIQISQWFLVKVLRRARERYAPTVGDILTVLYESPVFDPAGRELLSEGLAAYLREDLLKAIHILIPQVERALRNLLALLGVPTNKSVRTQPGIMEVKNINDILSDSRVRTALGEDIWRYLQVLLADRRGLNLRNRVAHGLVTLAEFNRPTADQVLHALLTTSLIREKDTAQ